jgi:hypothetical protein
MEKPRWSQWNKGSHVNGINWTKPKIRNRNVTCLEIGKDVSFPPVCGVVLKRLRGGIVHLGVGLISSVCGSL